MAWWDEQPMADYGSSADQFYGAGGQPVASYSGGGMPMNAGPAFDMSGGYNALSGNGGMTTMPDVGMNSFQQAMSQAGGQMPAAYTPEIQPSGGGSWFKRLLSATVLGMAGGAGAPDAMTGFSAGYATVAAQRQAEAQQAAMMEKQRREEQLYHMDMVKKNYEVLKIQKELADMPIELQQKAEDRQLKLAGLLKDAGMEPQKAFPASPEGVVETQKQMKKLNENMLTDYFWVGPVNGQMLGYQEKMNDNIAPAGTDLSAFLGKTFKTQYDMPWSAVTSFINNITSGEIDAKTKYIQSQENARAAAGRTNAYSIAQLSSGNKSMPEWMQPGSFTDAQKNSLYSIQDKIDQLQSEKNAAMQSPTADTSSYDSRINQLFKQKEALSNQFIQENQSRVTRTQSGQMIQTPAGPKPYGTPMTTKSGQTVYLIGIDSNGNPITQASKP